MDADSQSTDAFGQKVSRHHPEKRSIRILGFVHQERGDFGYGWMMRSMKFIRCMWHF